MLVSAPRRLFLTPQFFSFNLLHICFRPPNISFLTLGSKKRVFPFLGFFFRPHAPRWQAKEAKGRERKGKDRKGRGRSGEERKGKESERKRKEEEKEAKGQKKKRKGTERTEEKAKEIERKEKRMLCSFLPVFSLRFPSFPPLFGLISLPLLPFRILFSPFVLSPFLDSRFLFLVFLFSIVLTCFFFFFSLLCLFFQSMRTVKVGLGFLLACLLCSFLPIFSFHLTICFRHFHGFLVLTSVPLLSFRILFSPFVLSFSLGFLFCSFPSLFSSLAFSLRKCHCSHSKLLCRSDKCSVGS